MARMQRSLFDQLNALAAEIAQSPVKTAAEKSAGPVPADPGGYQGASSHPTTSADNGVQNATTGARASEYEADIKKQQGALAVDNTPEMSQEGRQDDVQTNIGVSAKATGEDPSNEKDFKGDKDDPGTTSPVKANDGEKYSSVTFKEARDRAGALGNDILANLINFGADKLKNEKVAEMPAALAAAHEKKESPAEEKSEHASGEEKADGSHGELKGDQHKLDVNNNGKIEGSDLAALRSDKAAAFKAGYELATQLGLSKEAAEASVRDVCANTLREADEMADLFIGFVTSKAAAADPTEEAAEGEDHSAPADAASGASDAPPADAAAGAAPAGLEAMMGAEGGGDMGPEAAGGGEPSEDEAVQELAMALEELGIPPEALLQALSGAEGGGAPAPEAGAPPVEEPKMAAAKDLDAIGRAVVNFKRAGKFQVKEARTKRSRQLRDMMKQHVIELVNR
ncbi:hypothetical protein EBZ80_16465 [bacterium]|nr:hypothetical protein [Betaproteobacteria bacterium]NDE16517.1 hypothetical protein [bacterium]